MLWTDFSTADVLIVISLCVNFFYAMKLIERMERRIKALEDDALEARVTTLEETLVAVANRKSERKRWVSD